MNAIGYLRISLTDQSEYSLEYQQRLITNYCRTNNLTLLSVFTDNGQSSYTFDRPDFQNLEAFIKKNRDVQYLIVSDHDRLSRNLAEALMKIKELQDKYKIKVLATTDPFDTDFSDPATFMIRAFKYMMAESELHNIRKRTKNGMIQAAMNGRHANVAPYGYLNQRDVNDKPILVIDDEKANIVRRIYKEYLSGMDLEQVRTMAMKLGYKQKGNSAIRNILENRLYAGWVKVPEHTGRKSAYAKGLHSPIISDADYWSVQERLNKKTAATQKREEVFLRGVLRCWCGRKMTAGNSKGKTGKYYWYYLCPEHRQSLPAAKLHKQFFDLLHAMSLTPERLEWLKTHLAEKVGQSLQTRGEEIRKITEKLKSINRQIESTERKYLLKSGVSEATFNTIISELQAERGLYLSNLVNVSTDQSAYLARLNALLPNLCRLAESFEKLTLEKQQQFINIGFDGNLWYEGEIYRTLSIADWLRGNELSLKEKRLLQIEKPLPKLGVTPVRTRIGSPVETLLNWLELIA